MTSLLFACLLCAVLAGLAPTLHAQTPEIISWGENMPDWSSKLKLTAIREGCSNTPDYCAGYVTDQAMIQGVSRAHVSMSMDPSTAVNYAAQYSSLSLAYPTITEIGFDDFVNGLENLEIAGKVSDPGSFISSVITAAKSQNPNLKFGITTYEDSLTQLILTSSTWSNHGITYASIPASALAMIDH